MNQRIEKVSNELKPLAARELRWWTWKRVLVAVVVIMAILEIGTYVFNWTWTGFKSNDTVWDYLQLLLLPVALAIVPLWFMAEKAQQRIWLAQLKWVLLISIALLVVLFVGTYAFNWTWTGFKDHGRLWDWLSLLLVPVTVAMLPIWYSTRRSSSSVETGEQQHVQQPSHTPPPQHVQQPSYTPPPQHVQQTPPPTPAYQQDWPPSPQVQRVKQAPQE
jgi:cation transport ATPase